MKILKYLKGFLTLEGRLIRVQEKLKQLEYYQKQNEGFFHQTIRHNDKLSKEILAQIHQNRILQGKIESLNLKEKGKLTHIQDAEFKVFSQGGDDGIIQYLIQYLEISEKTFIEFGVQDYIEANTRFLLINNNWSGLIMDGSTEYINQIQKQDIYWQYDLTAVCAFIDTDNINSLISQAGFQGEIGLLHIDIDGNDYWVWKEINVIDPILVIMEYNSVFGCERAITVPYHKSFFRTEAHYSNLYFGASLPALCDLAEKKGYYFIGCNSFGNNAYFVKKTHIKDLDILSPKEGYVYSRFREQRDREGNLTFNSDKEREKIIRGLPVFNIETNQIENF